jgi:phosphoglycolate phosphatase-like HAD superfamily hydrolase
VTALQSWNDTETRQAIERFVEGPAQDMPPEERVAVFDNDGTLWCEKPMPVQLGFIVKRLAEMAAQDTSLRERQPWKAAHEEDFGWFGAAVTRHYAGDESDVKVLIDGILEAFEGAKVEDYAAEAGAYVRECLHPSLGRPFVDLGYQPMIELLRYLEANGFTSYIASGGGRDFMRPVTQEMYGIPPERVVGSSSGLRYEENEEGGSIVRLSEADVLDDGPEKPVRIWSRVGRRPILAGGNSNGDIPMLAWADGLRLLVLHDDAEREFDYVAGAEDSLERAKAAGWTVVSVKNDWTQVFA